MTDINKALLQQLSSKIGVVDSTIIEKATEYLRLLKLKCLRLTEPQKIILCIDIACTSSGTMFDRENALKLTGVKQKIYHNSRFSVLKLLHIEKTIYEICVQLSCEHIVKFAEEILEKYKAKDQIDRDFSHPQYVVAAVVTACTLKNFNINKQMAFSLSNLKARQWKQLRDEYMKFAVENNLKTGLKKKTIQNDDQLAKEIENKSQKTQNMELELEEEVIEEYEVWRKRILEEAYAHLNDLKK